MRAVARGEAAAPADVALPSVESAALTDRHPEMADRIEARPRADPHPA